jgi:hypothetical protein
MGCLNSCDLWCRVWSDIGGVEKVRLHAVTQQQRLESKDGEHELHTRRRHIQSMLLLRLNRLFALLIALQQSFAVELTTPSKGETSLKLLCTRDNSWETK